MTNEQPVRDSSITANGIVDPYEVPEEVQVQLVDSQYSGRVVARALWNKLWRKLAGRARGLQPVALQNGVVVFDRAELHGGGLTDGQNTLRALHEMGIGPCERLFEFCSGPGYVGYSLLANGFCRTLALSDINSAAVEAARATAEFNGLQQRVAIYLSDGLAGIDPAERWDVVVGFPPCTAAPPPPGDVRYHNPGYQIHRAFYAGVKRFMRLGGRIVMLESVADSDPSIFEAMIQAGGGRLTTIRQASTLRDEPTMRYYVVSEW